LADGNVALALLCNAIATGAILVVLILVFGPLSGAHLNPVVSVAAWLRGDLPPRLAIAYGVTQIAGGIAGTLLAHAMFERPLLQAGTIERAGAGQWLAEAVAAFGLVLTVIGTSRNEPKATPYAVGLYITAAYWFTASTSFANPAVTRARTLTDSFSGIRPIDAPAVVLAQLVGGASAALLFRWLDRAMPPRSEGA
jgi:glycerol uptake facilitator-like aquaporin